MSGLPPQHDGVAWLRLVPPSLVQHGLVQHEPPHRQGPEEDPLHHRADAGGEEETEMDVCCSLTACF